VCFDFFYNFCPRHFSFWEELCEISLTYIDWSSHKVPAILVFYSDLNFLSTFLKNIHINFIKIGPVAAGMFHAILRTGVKAVLCTNGRVKSVFLNRRAAARYRVLALIIPGRERPEKTTTCYKISLVQLITNLNVILYLSACHALYISVLKLKLRGLSSRANYTDRAAAAGRRS
jgi:hypothetical protein